jgi:RNA polymerase subunit RPABC4/transcription elongation factor Spt4
MLFVVRARRAPALVPAGRGPGAARASSTPEVAHPGPAGLSGGRADTAAAPAPPAPLAPPAAAPVPAHGPVAPDVAACGQCGAKLVRGEPFCPYCGAAVVAVCRRCGRPLEPGKPICPRCGARVHAANRGGA